MKAHQPRHHRLWSAAPAHQTRAAIAMRCGRDDKSTHPKEGK